MFIIDLIITACGDLFLGHVPVIELFHNCVTILFYDQRLIDETVLIPRWRMVGVVMMMYSNEWFNGTHCSTQSLLIRYVHMAE